MKAAVLGCGSIGQRHTRNLIALGARVIAFDPDPDRLRAAAQVGAESARTVDELFGAHADVALVCTPPSLHVEGLRAALDAGLDVFVEKPIATTLPEASALVERAERERRLVAVGYNLRFHAGLAEAKRLIDGGTIGKPLLVRAEFGQYLPDWRPAQDYRRGYNASATLGGGMLFDQSHEIDYVRWIFGEVTGVSAVTARVSDLAIDSDDTALLHLRLGGGALAEIHLDSVRRDYRRGCTVEGSDGTIEWDLRSGIRVHRAGHDVEEHRVAPDVNDMYVDEVRDLLARVASRSTPAVDGRTGLRVLEIVLAAERAAAERREIEV